MAEGHAQNGTIGIGEALLSPKTHKKYIYMWNISHRKPTANRQISYPTKTERSPCNWVRQKKKKKRHPVGIGVSGRDLQVQESSHGWTRAQKHCLPC